MEFLSVMWLAFLGLFGVAPEPAPAAVTPIPPTVVTVPDDVTPLPDLVVTEEESATAPEAVLESVTVSPEPTPMTPESEPEPADQMTGAVAPVSALTLPPMPTPEPANTPPNIKTMLVAGGCFWCVEADLEKTNGVISAVSGYAGGTTGNPTYSNYGSGGHREVVEVTYDANVVSYEDLLIVTMKTTDPTDGDGTFADRGDKYSSAFYYETPEQKAIIDNLIAEVDANGPYTKPLAIDVEPRTQFWPAEDNHQDYYKGTLTQLKYQYYRNASGRTKFIEDHWGVNDHSPALPWRDGAQGAGESAATAADSPAQATASYPWSTYVKPDKETLRQTLDPLAFRVTQEDGTERAGTSPLDKVWDRGIYVDILSGEPLYSSRDKFDSGTGWPSFVRPISDDALTLHEDRKLFVTRTETRSAIADNHIGHVFNDGPTDRGGMRYCMNGAALRFVPEADMAAQGYGDFLGEL